MLLGWPKVTWFAIKSAIRSLILSEPYPDTIVIGSHIEALVFGLFRAVLFRKQPDIVLLGFILTNRPNIIINTLRGLYFRIVFSIVDKVICHSSLEVDRYKKLFPHSRAEFFYIPYGLHIWGREKVGSPAMSGIAKCPYILAAGRSGRDYATLFEAIAPLPIALHVVCDSDAALAGMNIPENVLLLRNCYDEEYVNELRSALFVVIPLKVNDISAGQMVLIQAMAFSKPTIITRTPTVEEYVTDGRQSLLVSQGSAMELRAAIERLLSDKTLVEQLAANAKADFEAKFCMKAYVKHLIECVTKAN